MPQAPLAYYVIADEDTVLGFRYAGVTGEAVASARQARAAFQRAVQQRRARILILTEVVAETIRDEVNAVRTGKHALLSAPGDRRATSPAPLVVEIPGPTGPMPGKRTLLELIQEAVGVRV